jgi:nitroreductase/dihydropteridine reductase
MYLDAAQILEALQRRHAIKHFVPPSDPFRDAWPQAGAADDMPSSESQPEGAAGSPQAAEAPGGHADVVVEALIEVARLAPSSFGLQPYRLVVVSERARLGALAGAAAGNAQVRDCSHLFVLQARRHIDAAFIEQHIAHISEVRSQPIEDLQRFAAMLLAGPGRDPAGREGLIWAQRQCYTVLGHLLLAAALMGVAACPMEGFSPPAFDAILGDEGTWTTTVLLAVGEPDAAAAAAPIKVRRPAQQFVRRL